MVPPLLIAKPKKLQTNIGYPVVVRPSYVLGGRAMEIVYNQHRLEHYMQHAVKASPEHPVLIDDFLDDATEIDVDALSDGIEVVIGGVMEHIEEAGIHSGDSACSLPAFSLPPNIIDEIKNSNYCSCKRAQCNRSNQYPICCTEWRDLYYRSKPSGLSHHSICK